MRQYIATLALVLGFAAQAQNTYALPDLGSPSEEVLSENQELEYKKSILQQMHQYNYIINDAVVSSYIYHLGYRLAEHSDKPGIEYEFHVVPDRSINASAYPGGLIVVHTGLMLETESESELAAVLAHEIAHVSQRHISRRFAKQSKAALPFLLGTLAALAAAQNSSSGDATLAVGIGATALQQQLAVNYTRHNEYEADRVGIQTLHKSQLDPNGMASFFSKLMQKNRVDDRYALPEFVRTHPLSVNRVSEAKNRIQSLPDQAVAESKEYALVKERIRVMTDRNLTGLKKYYRDALASGRNDPDAMLYGLALAMYLDNEFEASYRTLQQIKPEPSIQLLIDIARVEALAEFDWPAAQARLDQLTEIYLHNPVVAESAIELYVKQGRLELADRAVELAKGLTVLQSDNPYYYELLSKANQHALKKIPAGEALARKEHLLGRNYRAVRILKSMLRFEQVDYYQRAEITALITAYEPLITAEERRREIAAERG